MSIKTLVMIPTYNEVDNVAKLAGRILNLSLPCDILFIDDDSPDLTGIKLDAIKGMYRSEGTNSIQVIHVIHRSGKLGVGSAHKVGITYAYKNGFDYLITMDCDGTHDPADIPEFIHCARSNICDVVVGSRHILAGSLEGWSLWRKFVTNMGHLLTKLLLGMPYDATGAFRLYNLNTIPMGIFNKVQRDDYGFFFESLTILHTNLFRIAEVPIILAARSAGHSKLKTPDLIASLLFMAKMRYYLWFDRQKVLR